MSVPLRCEVSEIAPLADGHWCYVVRQPPPHARAHGKRNGVLWSICGLGSQRLLRGSEHPHHENAQLEAAWAPQQGMGEGGEAQNSQVQTSKGYNPALFTAGPRAEWHPIDCVLCTAHCTDSFCSTAICMLAGDAPNVLVCQINRPGDSLCHLQCQRLGGKRYTTAFLSMRVQKGDERTDANHKKINWGAGN